MPAISAVIITLNEAANLPRCIESLEEIVDQCLIYDSGSTDGTIEWARQKKLTVIEGEWLGYAATKNAANQQAAHPYILSIDALFFM